MSVADLLIALIPSSSALAPGRRREARLAGRQLLGPDDRLLAVLPLEHHHLVGDLKAVRVDFEGAVDVVEIQLENGRPDLLPIERPGALDRLEEDLAATVACGGVIGE